MDASEENDGYSSAEDPLNSDPEDEGKKLVGHGIYFIFKYKSSSTWVTGYFTNIKVFQTIQLFVYKIVFHKTLT